MQREESIEDLGLELQALGHKAFPLIQGREFDRLLKGRCFQALHVKWQRKLGVPKPEETFPELYDRARVLEHHEKQYEKSAATRSGISRSNYRTKEWTNTKSQLEGPRVDPLKSSKVCFHCKQAGHIARDCPQRGRQPEAPGRSQGSRGITGRKPGSTVSASHSNAVDVTQEFNLVEILPVIDNLSVQELEALLTEKRLQAERNKLPKNSGALNNVTVNSKDSPQAVRPTVSVRVEVCGVPIEAMLDTGAQSTIISRELLHKIVRGRQAQGKDILTLQAPTARLYCKDGVKGGQEIVVTAQLEVEISIDGESANVPVFVQPESSPPCLLGMNAIPALGFVSQW